MTKILFGGPEEKPEVHNNLIKRLRDDLGYHVLYSTKGDDFMGYLNGRNIPVNPEIFDMVIYDTELFYPNAHPKRRAELFKEKVIGYLSLAETKVIVIADTLIKEMTMDAVLDAKYAQLNKPYTLDMAIEIIKIELQS